MILLPLFTGAQEINDGLRNNPTIYVPGTIDGEPQSMRTIIHLQNLKFSN